jgi:hypothetical protein
LSNFFGRLRNTVFLETTLDDVDSAHASIFILFQRTWSSDLRFYGELYTLMPAEGGHEDQHLSLLSFGRDRESFRSDLRSAVTGVVCAAVGSFVWRRR